MILRFDRAPEAQEVRQSISRIIAWMLLVFEAGDDHHEEGVRAYSSSKYVCEPANVQSSFEDRV